MADEVVRYEERDGVALVTLNRPDRMNAWTLELEDLFFDRMAEADAAWDVRAIVVTGAGRGFCAGADFDLLAGRTDVQFGVDNKYPGVFLASLRKPIIAALNGAAAGVGLAQALLCDVRFAAAGSKLTFSFPRRGLVAEYGTSWTLPRIVGHGRAMDLLLTGRVVLAEEAYELGLVNRVVPGDDLLDHALAYARDLAEQCSPASMAVIKAQVLRDWETDLEAAGRDATRLMIRSFGEPDFKEGIRSLLKKRPPAFPPLGEGSPFTL